LDKALKLPPIKRGSAPESVLLRAPPGTALGAAAPAFMNTFTTLFLMSATDPSGRIIDVNENFCKISGYTREELIGANHRLINSGYHPRGFFLEMWQEIAAGNIWRGEICNRAKDGSTYWVDSVIAPECDEAGNILRYVSIRTDITARKLAERILHSPAQFSGNNVLGWWECDIETRRMFWSDGLCRLQGVSPGHRPGYDELFDFVSPGCRAALHAAFERCADDGAGWDIEVQLETLARPAGAGEVWLRSVGNAEWRQGSIVRISGAIEDISARVALERLTTRVTLAARSGQIGIWEYDIGTGGLIWDEVMYRLYGVSPAGGRLTYADWRNRLHREDVAATLAAMGSAAGGGTPFDREFRILRDDGEIRHIRATAEVIFDAAGLPMRMVGVNWDMTTLRRLTAELAEQREMLQVTLDSIGDAVITTNEMGAVSWMNPVAERLTGWVSADAADQPLSQVLRLVHQETRLPAQCPALACLARHEIIGMPSQTLLIARGGTEYCVEDSAAPIRNARGDVLGVVVVFRDVTEQRRTANEMNYRATHDALTGLLNRAEFDVRLKRVLHTAQQDSSQHGVMFIDLDQFKLVNDVCGHGVGDQMLQQVARLLERSVRGRDTVARLGGDEFGILLERCPPDQAQRIGAKICAMMDEFRFTHDGKRFRVGTSIGLVILDASWRSTAGVMQAADTSAYVAKVAGGNRVHLWAESDTATAARQNESGWATRIEQALDEDRFTLFGQRIESLGAPAPKLHAELLLRMLAPDGRLIEPRAFLPAAERFHLATRIDRWVVRQALKILAGVKNRNAIGMLAINLSAQSIGDRMFHRFMSEMLDAIDPALCALLCLEITETAAIINMQDASDFVNMVHDFGVRVALDDFGAGASSFGYLRQMKVDFIKIDGQFITGLVDNPLDNAAVRCFADVAQVIGVKTVAEFVERPDVLPHLRALGIDFGQGYLLHRPQPLDTLLEEGKGQGLRPWTPLGPEAPDPR
jgi:diguanylate cyclase (GGDEF)-like protein/PAS domain S-box-containing protein